jgi:hypothetical protein
MFKVMHDFWKQSRIHGTVMVGPCLLIYSAFSFSLLREHTIDGSGWAPTRKLKDLVWGINSLFTVREFNVNLTQNQSSQNTKIFTSLSFRIY